MKNIITIDIDTERDQPIKVTKNIGIFPEEHEYDNMVMKDVKDLVLTSLYLASMLDIPHEKKVLKEITEMLKNRTDEIERDTEQSSETSPGEEER